MAALLMLIGAAAWPQAPVPSQVAVVLVGVTEEIRTKLVPGLAVSTLGKESATEAEIRRAFRRSQEQIGTSLQAFGYYRATIEARLERPGGKGNWTAEFKVDPGPPLRYAEVAVEVPGAAGQEPEISAYLAQFPLKPGDVLIHQKYESAKQELLRRVTELGYVRAELERNRVEVSLEKYEARAELVVASGPKFVFDEIRLNQDVLNPAFLRRYVAINPGDTYRYQRLLELEASLRDTQYFSSVSVEPRLGEAEDGRVPVDVNLEPAKAAKYAFGLGFGTDEGIRGTLGYERRRVNRRGHRVTSEIKVAQIGGSFDTRYIVPIRNPHNDQFSVLAEYEKENPDTNDTEYGRTGVSQSVLMGRTRRELLLVFQRETFTVADQEDTVNMLIAGIGFSRVTADDRLNTGRGLLTEVGLQGSHDILSDVQYLQGTVRGKLVYSLGERARVLTRGEAAYTLASAVTDLPASLRFFAGGDRSVRGFGYKTLGPTNADGDVIGGRHLLVGSLEMDYRFADKWRIAAFMDAGNAFDDFNEPLEKSVGLGIRWLTPIGPVRMDLAQPIDSDAGSLRLHVYMGPDL